MIKKFEIIIICLFAFIISCHPCYKRLTSLRNGWGKDTVLIRFPDLPKPILDTLSKYYEAKFTKDTTDNVPYLISFNHAKQFKEMYYYDMDSPKFRLPFGFFFKLGKKKYFIYRSDFRTPLVYSENYLYFPSGKFFETLTNKERYNDSNKTWINKQLYIKYKIK